MKQESLIRNNSETRTNIFESFFRKEKRFFQIFSLFHCQSLNNSGIFHRDNKNENILLDVTTLKTKLIDFGCGDFHSNKNYEKFSGTVQFAPPEVHLGPYRGSPVTVWSIGALAYTLLVGDVPYETREDVIGGNCKKPNWRDSLSVPAADFISGCMKSNPSQRPRLTDQQNHALLQTL